MSPNCSAFQALLVSPRLLLWEVSAPVLADTCVKISPRMIDPVNALEPIFTTGTSALLGTRPQPETRSGVKISQDQLGRNGISYPSAKKACEGRWALMNRVTNS